MMIRKLIGYVAAAGLMCFSLAGPATAQFTTYSGAMSGFTYNSDTINGAFNAALGSGYTHLSFAGASSFYGANYSSDVLFSTVGFGPTVDAANKIGPGPGQDWTGGLRISFLTGSVSTVGFGGVDLAPNATVILYDGSMNVLGVFFPAGSNLFELWGVSDANGPRIQTVDIAGGYFAIQDLSYSSVANPVPEPETYAMLLAGLGLLGIVARRRKNTESAKA